MISIVVSMLVILAIAGAVLLYVVFPHRGADMPRAPWVGEAMRRAVVSLPTVDNQRGRQQD